LPCAKVPDWKYSGISFRGLPFTTVIESFTDVDAMVTDKKISDAELDMMEVLWAADQPLTSADVAERLEARGWSLATIKTMLSRLAAKGAISHREDGRRFLYSPAIEREAYVGSESRKFVDRLFGGRLSPLVARLAEEDALDEEDIAAIEALLKELKS
jgi:BlaI family transcriptional regulator, penicillinase repressor